MTAEEYIKSQLDGTFVKWLGIASYETQGAGYPFEQITVPKDYVPPMCRPRSEEVVRPMSSPRIRKPSNPSAQRGHRKRREFTANERKWIDTWMNEGWAQDRMVAQLHCGRETLGRYLKELRSK
jgi:hypothetical protein